MRVLFDQGTPEPLRRALAQHEIVTAYERGWSKLNNGELLDAAEKAGFDVLVTTYANLKHQQNHPAKSPSLYSPHQVGGAFNALSVLSFVQLKGQRQVVTRRYKSREQDG